MESPAPATKYTCIVTSLTMLEVFIVLPMPDGSHFHIHYTSDLTGHRILASSAKTLKTLILVKGEGFMQGNTHHIKKAFHLFVYSQCVDGAHTHRSVSQVAQNKSVCLTARRLQVLILIMPSMAVSQKKSKLALVSGW